MLKKLNDMHLKVNRHSKPIFTFHNDFSHFIVKKILRYYKETRARRFIISSV